MTPIPAQENRVKPYEYIDDADCSKLGIYESALDRTAVVSAKENGKSHVGRVPADAVPPAALALYEAAGLPEPLILENLPRLGAGLWRPHEESVFTLSRQG